jgi:hypothetical protein
MTQALELFHGAFFIGAYTCQPFLGILAMVLSYLYIVQITNSELLFGAFVGGIVSSAFAKNWHWKPRDKNMFKCIMLSYAHSLVAYAWIPALLMWVSHDDISAETGLWGIVILEYTLIPWDIWVAKTGSAVFLRMGFVFFPEIYQRFILILGGTIIVAGVAFYYTIFPDATTKGISPSKEGSIASRTRSADHASTPDSATAVPSTDTHNSN